MGYSNKDADDIEKLRVAFAELKKLGSVENLLEAFGLSGMPQAQRYGIFFGLVVFSCTLTAVIGLLVMGGSFKRIAEQADTGEATRLTATDQRAHRALLLERLLDGRERLNKNYSPEPTTENLTNLTKMLCNEAPEDQLDAVPKLVEDESATQVDEMKRTFPPFYARIVRVVKFCLVDPKLTLRVTPVDMPDADRIPRLRTNVRIRACTRLYVAKTNKPTTSTLNCFGRAQRILSGSMCAWRLCK
jgi:hypothetical protein